MGKVCHWMVLTVAVLIQFRAVLAVLKGPDLLIDLNPDLEINSTHPDFVWVPHKKCSFETVSDSYTGERSLRVFNRNFDSSSPRLHLQRNVLRHGHTYFYSFYIKFLKNPSGLTHFNVSLTMRLNKIGVLGDFTYTRIALLKFQRAGSGWQQMGGDFRMPTETERDYRLVHLYVQLPKEVEFLFDTNCLYELIQPEPAQWLTDVNDKIRQERTNHITLTGTIPWEYNLENLEIKVEQQSCPFKFGSAVKVDDFIDTTSSFCEAYRQFFYDNFDMAVTENAMKWKIMVFRQDIHKQQRVETFLDMMDINNIPVRAHTVLWGKPTTQPHWLVDGDPVMNSTSLRAEIDGWIDWVCGTFANRFVQWDVYNEYLHGHFYEAMLEDEDFLLYVFRRVAERCTGDLYTNDYELLRSSISTVAQMDLTRWLLNEGMQLAGIGAQTHIKENDFVRAHIEMLEHRLELLCDLGLPVMITEMSVHHANVSVRAEKLDQVLRLFYSRPCVQSVLLWGYSDQNAFLPDMVLAEGTDVQPNEAGDVWHSLTRGEWKTRETILPSANQLSDTFRGHHGDYNVTVSYNGNPIVTSSFTLSKDQDVKHDIVFPALS